METEAPKKKKLISNVLIIFVIFGVLLIVVSSIGDFNEIFHEITSANPYWMALSLFVSLISMIVLSISNQMALRALDKDLSYFTGLLIQTTESFYSGITPFGSGHQPFQIYEFTQKGVKSDLATAVSLVNFIVYQTVTVVLVIVALSVYWFDIFAVMGWNITYILVGVVLNSLILVLLLLLGYAQGFKNFIEKILQFFTKYKWSRKWAQYGLDKSEAFIVNFQHGVQYLMPKKRVLIASSVLKIVASVLKYGSIIIIVIALGHHLTIAEYVYLTAASYLAINAMMWVPLPGASGGTEFALGSMLAAVPLFSGDQQHTLLLVVVLLWRFGIYYFQLLIGFIAYIWLRTEKNV